jgi:hypothetical protein
LPTLPAVPKRRSATLGVEILEGAKLSLRHARGIEERHVDEGGAYDDGTNRSMRKFRNTDALLQE